MTDGAQFFGTQSWNGSNKLWTIKILRIWSPTCRKPIRFDEAKNVNNNGIVSLNHKLTRSSFCKVCNYLGRLAGWNWKSWNAGKEGRNVWNSSGFV